MKPKRRLAGRLTGRPSPGRGLSAARFFGATLAEAITGVRMAYGPGAVILSTRTHRRYGLFGPARVEVLARPGDPPAQAETPRGPEEKAGAPTARTGGAAQGLRGTLEDLLRTAGVAPWLATMLATNALSESRGPLLSTRQLAAALGGALDELMGQPRPVEAGAGPGRVIAFVGLNWLIVR